MEFNGILTDIRARIKTMKIKPHTKLNVNGQDRVWYGNKAMSVQAYINVKQRQKDIPVEQIIINSSKQYDKDHNLFFDLTVEHVLRMRVNQKDHCQSCNTIMQVQNRKLADGLTIERLDATFGHTKENCVLACWECNCVLNIRRTINKMKSNAYFKQFVLDSLNIV
jgi:hypothetical protein